MMMTSYDRQSNLTPHCVTPRQLPLSHHGPTRIHAIPTPKASPAQLLRVINTSSRVTYASHGAMPFITEHQQALFWFPPAAWDTRCPQTSMWWFNDMKDDFMVASVRIHIR